jgi:hypothetical protein
MNIRRGLDKASLFGNKYRCVYCGCPADTNDHTPPACLLREPYPNNLLSVPACTRCNNGFSEDENLVSLILARVSFEPDLMKEWKEGKAASAVTRDRKLSRFFDDHIDKNGIFWPDADTIRRIDRVLAKTIQGLYYHRYRRVLAPKNLVLLSLTHQRQVTAEGLLQQHCCGGTIHGWPEVTASGRALKRLLVVGKEVFDVSGRAAKWVEYQHGVFSYIFAKGVEGGLVCVLDLHSTLAAAFRCPWPGRSRRGSETGSDRKRRRD